MGGEGGLLRICDKFYVPLMSIKLSGRKFYSAIWGDLEVKATDDNHYWYFFYNRQFYAQHKNGKEPPLCLHCNQGIEFILNQAEMQKTSSGTINVSEKAYEIPYCKNCDPKT